MGLLLSVLITCVGVLEVIACYTHFRIGAAYSECKSNIRDIAKYYAVELRKHELHFESGPDDGGGSSSSQETLTELIRKRANTVRTQERSQNYSKDNISTNKQSNGHLLSPSCSKTPDRESTPIQIAPRNSITEIDPKIVKQLSPDVNITEAFAEKIQNHENDSNFWSRKSPSPLPADKTGLEVVDKDFWRSRSPSPFPDLIDSESKIEPELIYTPGLRKHQDSDLLESPIIPNTLQKSPSGSELVEKDFWNKTNSSVDSPYSKTDLEIQNILPADSSENYSKHDFEIQDIISQSSELEPILRQPSPYPEILFAMTTNDEETKFDEEFLRSLDGVRSAKSEDKRRNFRKKRNSSSTSSRASREDLRSLTSLEDFETQRCEESKEMITTPLPEEDCESLINEVIHKKEEANVTKQEQTHFTATESTSNAEINKPTNVSFTEKVKDLEISVQLMVTVKGTSQGDQMQYTTTVTQDDKSSKSLQPQKNEETVTRSKEESSEFGKVKTSVTYGSAKLPENQSSTNLTEIKPSASNNDLKDLQISSQSLIHAERTLQDNVKSSENEFLKLYESFTELAPREKDKFLKIITQSQSDIENEASKFSTLKQDPENKELILVKEITEITESIESITTIPPEINKINENKKTTIDNQKILSSESLNESKDINSSLKPNETNEEIDKRTQINTKEEIINSDIKLITEIKEDEIVSKKDVLKIEENKLETINQISSEPNKINESESVLRNQENVTSSDIVNSQNINEDKLKIEEISSKAVNEENKLGNKIEEQQNEDYKDENIVSKEMKIEDNSNKIEETSSKITKEDNEVKKEGSSSSSSTTPSTVIDTQLRRASKTSFEDASQVQNVEMMKRRISNTEISPKQASQAFWLIFSAEYTNAMEKDWHGQHFSCWQCDESLTGQRYVLREEHPYCVKCYEQVFANTCEKCNRIIGIDSKDLSYKEKHWHEACFQCTTCNESLVDKQFGAKGEKIYCGNCYDKQFASKCDGCGKIFHAGTKKMEYKNRQWHEQCFKCCKCDTPIGTKSFIPREKDIYCAGCYEEKFATRCVKCKKAIQSGGVTYKNEPWHRECFTCTHCDKNLAGQRFTSRDDKPCCAECFGRLFAKRCTSCNEPITGIGGTRFISFEDRHWHNDCFICASCSTSLVGRGFITDEEKIICPECAKERFM